jgi:IclR family acetate operon transcriptional repressor
MEASVGDRPRPARPRVQSAARAVSILLAVARSANGLTTKEIAEQVGIGRQATYHLLHTLVETGTLAKSEGNRYVLGPRVGTLAEGFTRQLDPGKNFGPILREMTGKTGETCYVTGWWSNEISVLAISRGTNPVSAAEIGPGHVAHAHARASGKLLLAYLTQSSREQYLESHDLTPMTAKTITDKAKLEEELAQIRDQGYSEDDEEYALGLCCLAVPVDDGLSPFALAISAPRERFVEERPRLMSTLMDAARKVGGVLSPG